MISRNEKHIRLFNRIAGVYNWFFKRQVKKYQQLLDIHIDQLKIPVNSKILDVGCGTGAFGKVFLLYGFQVKGIDASIRMVKKAKENKIFAEQQDILNDLTEPDNYYDLVTAANVVHGFKYEDRLKIYQECLRVSKGKVLFHDYNSNKNIGVSLIEWFEKGAYQDFIKKIPAEFFQVFNSVEILHSSGTSSWYLCCGKEISKCNLTY